MTDALPESSQQLRSELLFLVKALKGHIIDHNKFAAGLQWKNLFSAADIIVDNDQNAERELSNIQRHMADCQLCPLGKTRRNIVFGSGNPHAQIVFIGEAPGADEDEQGLPFVGRAGQLLTRIIEAMGLSRKDVYICNILKCRPPQNRNPLPNEITTCEPFLKQQLKVISPKIICALGTFAAKTLLRTEIPITVLRGRFHSYNGIPLMPTYHPAYLLRNPAAKKLVWEDVQLIMKEISKQQYSLPASREINE